MTISVLSSPVNQYNATAKQVKEAMADISRQQVTQVRHDKVSSMQQEGLYFEYENLVTNRDKLEALTSTNIVAEKRLGFQQSFITQMRNFVTDIRGKVQQFNAATANVDMAQFAKLQLRQLGLTLNDRTFGYYEFAGANGDTPPIADIEQFIETSNVKDDGTVNASYSSVMPDTSTNKIDFNREIAISIDVTDPAFQHLIGALHLISNLAPGDSPDDAINMLDKSQDLFSKMEVIVGFNDRILQDAKQSIAYANSENSRDFGAFSSKMEDLVLANQEHHRSLQAIFSAMMLANRVSLIDFR